MMDAADAETGMPNFPNKMVFLCFDTIDTHNIVLADIIHPPYIYKLVPISSFSITKH